MKLSELKSRLMNALHVVVRKPAAAPMGALFEVNVFPLKNTVLFPGGLLPLHIFEDRYKAMAEDAVTKHVPVAMSPALTVDKIVPGAVCGGGKITVLQEFPDKRKNVLIEADSRFRVRQVIQADPFCKVLAERLEDVPFSDESEESLFHARLTESVRRWIFANPSLDDGLIDTISIFDKPHQLADFVGSHFLPTIQLKQSLLEQAACIDRVRTVIDFLEGETKGYVKLIEGNTDYRASVPKSEMH
jgi:Lon protease-like protein